MFFYLSKIITFLIDPLFLILLFSFLCLLFVRWRWRIKRYAYFLFILFYLVSTPALINRLFYYLEHLEKPTALAAHYDGVIVLSGMTDLNKSSGEDVEFTQAVDRILAGVRLVRHGTADYLIISGGDGGLVRKNRSEARVLYEFAKRMGIHSDRIIIEAHSRNTYENALNTAELVKKHKLEKLLLVTSAFHMYRSRGCFRNAGLQVDVYPVDFYAGKMFEDFRAFLPSSHALVKTQLFIHEAVGILVYGLTGKANYRIFS